MRSPGSALKPFIYGLGFEDGLIHPETLIEDRPIRYGSYAPENFDLTFQGTVTVRRALQMSLNVPAVAVLDEVGAEPADRAARAGRRARWCCPRARRRDSRMGLGGVGIRLTDLTMLYAGLARQGDRAAAHRALGRAERRRRAGCIDPVAAWYVGNVLLGTPPPENAAGGRIAFKTGTSYGYRDAWAVGFDGKRTIGVWVGRPDGAPVPGLVGRGCRGADPVRCVRAQRPSCRHRCRRRRRARSSPPPPSCRRRCSASPPASQPARRRGRCTSCFRPTARGSSSARRRRPDPIAHQDRRRHAAAHRPGQRRAAAATTAARTLFFEPDGPGFVRLTVMDAAGAADSVMRAAAITSE